MSTNSKKLYSMLPEELKDRVIEKIRRKRDMGRRNGTNKLDRSKYTPSFKSRNPNCNTPDQKTDQFLKSMDSRTAFNNSYREADTYEGQLNMTSTSSNFNYGKSKEEIWKRLLEGKKSKQMEREHAKSVLDQLKFQEECSFHPSINQNSKVITERSHHGGERVEDKLYQEAFNKQKVVEKLRQASEMEMMKAYTFKPEIIERQNQPSTDRISIQDRYRDIQLFKEKMIADLRKKFLNDEELTFQPKISSKTERYAQTKAAGRPVIDRLEEEGKEIRERKRLLEYEAF